jgi:hypothetical protein
MEPRNGQVYQRDARGISNSTETYASEIMSDTHEANNPIDGHDRSKHESDRDTQQHTESFKVMVPE